MALYNFQRRFVPAILGFRPDLKTHTIRAKRKQRTKPGEMLHLYTGLRQKGAQLLLRAKCTKVESIEITPVWHVLIDGVILSPDEKEQLAWHDGFTSFSAMMDFWEGRLPFSGDVIHWERPSEPTLAEQIRRLVASGFVFPSQEKGAQ